MKPPLISALVGFTLVGFRRAPGAPAVLLSMLAGGGGGLLKEGNGE